MQMHIKNKKWQGNAATTAAACTRAVLGEWINPDKPEKSLPLQDHSSSDIPNYAKSRSGCLRSLSFSSIDNRLNNIALPLQGTCDWMLKTKEFQQWKDLEDLPNHNGVLWLKGKAGAGKSTLMKHTLAYCQNSFKDHVIAAYFFNARGSDLEKTPLGMFHSLLYQLIDKDCLLCSRFVLRFLEKKKHGAEWEWSVGELKDFLLSELMKCRYGPWILLIDALDECNEEEVYDVVSFLESLSEIAVRTGVSVHILLSSHHYPTIDMRKRLEIAVDKQKEHDKAIMAYIQSRLRTKNEKIEKELWRKADHVFLWVALVVEILNQECHGRVKLMQRKLHELPSGLSEVFTILLEKDNPNKPTTLLALKWMLFANTRLRPEEFYFAVLAGSAPEDLGSWNQDEEDSKAIEQFITSISRGLIEIQYDHNNAYIQFIHESVNDFLLRYKRLQTLDPVLSDHPIGNSHDQLVSCCMAYIMMSDLDSYIQQILYPTQILRQMFPFLRYATVHLFQHSKNAQADHVSQQEFLEQLQQREVFQRIQIFHTAMAASESETLGPNLIYMLSKYGYCELLKIGLLSKDAAVNAPGGLYGNALQATSNYGHRDILELLLKSGADANIQGGLYGSALQAASFQGHQTIVELLLESGADVNMQGGSYCTALQAASRQGHLTIVELLLKSNADVNIQGGYYGTALQAASDRGNRAIVELLLKNGADVNVQGGYFSSALQAASANDERTIVELLLKSGADVNIQGGYYVTRFRWLRFKAILLL